VTKGNIKSAEEIKIMSDGGKKLGLILTEALKKVKPGISTFEIDCWIDEGIIKSGGQASFKQVRNYQFASCVGVNNEVVHSLPSKRKIIKEGDLLKIDLGMIWLGFNTDLSWTIEVGTKREEFFLAAGKEALNKAIREARNGNRVGHLSLAIEETIKKAGFSPVKVLTGHGIGRKLHEEPMIPGVLNGKIEDTPKLVPGMTLAIEVIYAQKSPEVVLETDGWTISTKDDKISALFEQTVAVTDNDPLILTPLESNRGYF